MAKISHDPLRFEEALAAFRARVPITDDELAELLDEETERAFWVAGITQADIVAQVFDAIDRAIEEGTTFDEFESDVSDALERSWGAEIPGRLETIFRTNLAGAYNRGRYRILTHPAVKRERPYWRLDVIDDDRTSDICEELIDTVLPQDDPFWSSHYPPLHHACRTHISALTEEEAAEAGGPTDAPDVEADDGFGALPGDDDWTPDLSGYPEDLVDLMLDKLDL
jgi:SPP1 gp7 family putative phage head morphogenesis protein